MTVEDPIEYELPGVGQTQVNAKIDLTFAKALRAILRQDPDIIMIGEIRDFETAQIAIQASLTGHLVLATLHTNDAASAVTRLTDMGVEPFPAQLQPAGRAGAAAGAAAVPGTECCHRTPLTPALH
jgi:general secretion pathway protein E